MPSTASASPSPSTVRARCRTSYASSTTVRPATTWSSRGHAISEQGYVDMLGQFRDLAYVFMECSVENRHHGFSNVKETLEEIHKGMSKAFPCGAGLGLMGVATDGDVALCHRFAGSDAHKLGTV